MECGKPTSGNNPKEKWPSFPQEASAVKRASIEMGSHVHLDPLYCDLVRLQVAWVLYML